MASDQIKDINKDIEALNHLFMEIEIPKSEKEMLIFLIKNIINTAKDAIIGKKGI